MAISRNNPLLKNVSGKLGKVIVFKSYSYGTVISNYPDMSRVKPTKKQREAKDEFRIAVLYAKAVCAVPELKAAMQATLPKGRSVYHSVISEFVKKKS